MYNCECCKYSSNKKTDFNKHLKSNSEENLLYAYTYMCKFKVYNLDTNIVNKLKKNLI